eukprot:2250165-Prymnesium_polylepis.1
MQRPERDANCTFWHVLRCNAFIGGGSLFVFCVTCARPGPRAPSARRAGRGSVVSGKPRPSKAKRSARNRKFRFRCAVPREKHPPNFA